MGLVVWAFMGMTLAAPVLLWSVGRGLLGTPMQVHNQTRVLVVAAVMLVAIIVLAPRLYFNSAGDLGDPYVSSGWVVTAMYAVALVLTLAALRSSRPRPLKDGDRWLVPTVGWLLSGLATAAVWLPAFFWI